MKKLITFGALAALSISAASAQTFFDPNFGTGTNVGPGTAPLTDPVYSQTTSSGGSSPSETIAYTSNSMTTGDFSNNGGSAYIASSIADLNGSTINSQFTMTANYSAIQKGGQANIEFLRLYSTGGNNDLLNITFQPFGYSSGVNIGLGGGIQYGGGNVTAGNASFSSSGINSLNGVALTFNLTTQIIDNGATPGSGGATENFTITTTGTVSSGNTVLYNYDLSRTGDTVNQAFSPSTSPLYFQLGVINDDNGGGLVNSDAYLTFSNVVISGANGPTLAVPEPSAFALLLGGLGALVQIARRRLA